MVSSFFTANFNSFSIINGHSDMEKYSLITLMGTETGINDYTDIIYMFKWSNNFVMKSDVKHMTCMMQCVIRECSWSFQTSTELWVEVAGSLLCAGPGPGYGSTQPVLTVFPAPCVLPPSGTNVTNMA